MNWKILVLSIFLTIIFFLTLMFYLGFDLDTFKRVALIQSLLVVVAIIFDYMERRKTPIFRMYCLPLTWYFICFWFYAYFRLFC